MIEYGLILGLIFVVMAVGVGALSQQVVSTWGGVSNKVNNAS